MRRVSYLLAIYQNKPVLNQLATLRLYNYIHSPFFSIMQLITTSNIQNFGKLWTLISNQERAHVQHLLSRSKSWINWNSCLKVCVLAMQVMKFLKQTLRENLFLSQREKQTVIVVPVYLNCFAMDQPILF